MIEGEREGWREIDTTERMYDIERERERNKEREREATTERRQREGDLRDTTRLPTRV